MKLTVTRKELYEGLQVVSRTVSSHTSLPVLKNVLIEPFEGRAENGGRRAGESSSSPDLPDSPFVRLSATDLELGVQVLVPAAVQEGGPLTVPARTFGEIVAGLPEADVSLGADESQTMVICCRRSEYRINGMTAEEFPALPEVSGTAGFHVAQPVMKSIIRQTVFAASDDDTRPILTGVCLILSGDRLRMVATDTHRLAVRNAVVQKHSGAAGGPDGDLTVIVPARALGELSRVLGDGEESTLEVKIDQNQILFRTERVTLVSRLIEGQFPRYERVIPGGYARRLTIPREELQSALRRARIVARDASARDRVVFTTQGENLVVSAEAEGGKAHEEFEVIREGDDLTIAFNATYLLDVLGVLDCEGVFLEMGDALSPAVLRPVDGDDYLMVIMPMQIQ